MSAQLDVTEFGRYFHRESWPMVTKPRKTLDPTDYLRSNFSGYGLPPKGTTTVEDLEAYYVRGEIGRAGHAQGAEEREEHYGFPVSGDDTARWAADKPAHYGDIPDVTPRGALF